MRGNPLMVRADLTYQHQVADGSHRYVSFVLQTILAVHTVEEPISVARLSYFPASASFKVQMAASYTIVR
jgi:hypothetical protein